MTASAPQQHMAATDMLIPMLNSLAALANRAIAAQDTVYATLDESTAVPPALLAAQDLINTQGPQADAKLKELEQALADDDPFHATSDFARLYPLESQAFLAKWQDTLADIAGLTASISDAVTTWEVYVQGLPVPPTAP